MYSYTLVLRESSHSSMLVCPFTLVRRILGQSHVHLRLELITQVTVLFGRKMTRWLQSYQYIVPLADPIYPAIRHFYRVFYIRISLSTGPPKGSLLLGEVSKGHSELMTYTMNMLLDEWSSIYSNRFIHFKAPRLELQLELESRLESTTMTI